jgi:hypothetical protein
VKSVGECKTLISALNGEGRSSCDLQPAA